MKKKTLVLGASTNPDRYAYMAAHLLKEHGHPVVPIGIKKGEVAGETILMLQDKPNVKDVDTVTLYVGPANQKEWYDYILSLKPKRILFNPGTENDELEQIAKSNNIETEQACTLVLLRTNQY
ncbi:MAG: CoA-binding protein [Cyclobacteriaceae bacterium]|jgi:predicted CoA-binding protein|nr:CoA-binding protein [Cyclobacteriaceae bacterium]